MKRGYLLNQRYRIQRPLGQGGMGSVFLATDVVHARDVAIKLQTDDSLQAQAQFRREGEILRSLRHPNLPRVHALFQEHGQYYLVMDYVPGLSLEERLDRDSTPVQEARLLEWSRQLCDVLDYLHTHDPPVIFRDLKPANIMLLEGDRIKLVDFGIAKLCSQAGLTQTGARGMGSPGFSAPEQYSGGTTEASDIYSLGATLWCLLTGQPPPDSVQLAIGQATLPDLKALRPDLSEPTVRAVTALMALNPRARPFPMEAVKVALGLATDNPSGPLGSDQPTLDLARPGSARQPEGSREATLDLARVASPSQPTGNREPTVDLAGAGPEPTKGGAAQPPRAASRRRAPLLASAGLIVVGLCLAGWAWVRGTALPPDDSRGGFFGDVFFLRPESGDSYTVTLGEDIGLFRVTRGVKDQSTERRARTVAAKLNRLYHECCPICGVRRLEPEGFRIGHYTGEGVNPYDLVLFYAHRDLDANGQEVYHEPLLLATISQGQARDLHSTPKLAAGYWRDLTRDIVELSRGRDSSYSPLGPGLNAELLQARASLGEEASVQNLSKVLDQLTSLRAVKLRSAFERVPPGFKCSSDNFRPFGPYLPVRG